MNRPAPRPVRALQALEAASWPFEAAAFYAMRPTLRLLGRGDDHPVLLLPGFGAGDVSTLPLRHVLRAQGYWAHAWRLGRNLGPTRRAATGMRVRLEELHREHDRRVTIVGQSLGGVYARLLARERPKLVRQVITLGSPYRMMDGDRSNVEGAWRRVQHLHDGDLALRAQREQDRPALDMPATSIYTRRDGIAPWHLGIDTVGPRRENIEVRGSHIGMGVNPAVVLAVLDRLAQPEDEWRPFRPPWHLAAWYPRPASWIDAA